jgi:hypothetical protein
MGIEGENHTDLGKIVPELCARMIIPEKKNIYMSLIYTISTVQFLEAGQWLYPI